MNRRVLKDAVDTLQVRICGGAREHRGLLGYDSVYIGNKVAKEHAAFLFSAEERTDLGNTACNAGKEEKGSEA
jgi:hypothetical protein